MNVRARWLEISDIEQVFDIEKRSFSAPWSYDMLLSQWSNPQSRGFAATIDGTLTGYLLGSIVLDEINIQTIAVDAPYRRHGVARKLFAVLLECAQTEGVQTIHLETRKNNAAARALYRKIGFTEVGLRRNYYHDPSDDALLLTLRL